MTSMVRQKTEQQTRQRCRECSHVSSSDVHSTMRARALSSHSVLSSRRREPELMASGTACGVLAPVFIIILK